MTLRSIPHPVGGYRYLSAIPAYSAGVAAESGYEIHAERFRELRPLAESFDRIDRLIADRGLSPSSLVALELRSPAVFDLAAFHRFNDEYLALLRERDLITDDDNPIARTNVVPLRDAPTTPGVLTAFLVSSCDGGTGGGDFVVAGSGEMSGDLRPDSIVAPGDITDAGFALKVDRVTEEIAARMAALGVAEPDTVNVYTAHQPAALHELLRAGLPVVERTGYVRWHTRPPVIGVEFEMDCRRVSRWQYL